MSNLELKTLLERAFDLIDALDEIACWSSKYDLGDRVDEVRYSLNSAIIEVSK